MAVFKTAGGYDVLTEITKKSSVERGVLHLKELPDGSFHILFEVVSTASEYSNAAAMWWSLVDKEKINNSLSHMKMLVSSILELSKIKKMEFESGGALVYREYSPTHSRVKEYVQFFESVKPESGGDSQHNPPIEGVIPFDYGAALRFFGETSLRVFVIENNGEMRLAKRTEIRILDGVLGQLQEDGWPESRVLAKSFLAEIFYVMRLELVFSILISLFVLIFFVWLIYRG